MPQGGPPLCPKQDLPVGSSPDFFISPWLKDPTLGHWAVYLLGSLEAPFLQATSVGFRINPTGQQYVWPMSYHCSDGLIFSICFLQ